MPICVKCGKFSETCLCDHCGSQLDIEALCHEIIAYQPRSEQNPIWEHICDTLDNPHNFRNIVFEISEVLPTPRKEYIRACTLAANKEYVAKYSRAWLYETYAQIKDDPAISRDEVNRLRGLMLSAYQNDYRYQEADDMACKLAQYDHLPVWCYYALGDFYTKTRRYDEAEAILLEGLREYESDETAVAKLNVLLRDNQARRNAAESGKREYMPAPPEAKQTYVAFLATLGIDATIPVPTKKAPQAIPVDQYPKPIETRDADFDTFVAFDVETTGFSTKIDSIIEIGAIRVVNGKIVESAEFTFQELCKPYKRSLSQDIQQLTGITPADVKEAREMWEVFADFMKFVGNDVLLGFNCIAFDSQFLVRAGRYANIIMTNRFFDVMRYADQFKEQLGIDGRKLSLDAVASALNIENPRAHRALADAITTANVYLKLKAMDTNQAPATLDDLLSDLDDW